MKIQWLTTAPNPRTPATGHDAGQRGWKLHAINADDDDTFLGIGPRAAACGLRPRHGWSLDMFIKDRCKCCTARLGGQQPKIVKDGTETYAVIGVSGARAGTIQRVGPKNGGMWELQMVAAPREMVRFLKDAKAEALELARRY